MTNRGRFNLLKLSFVNSERVKNKCMASTVRGDISNLIKVGKQTR